jgi:hypothetical protein
MRIARSIILAVPDDEKIRHHIESHMQRTAEHFMGGFLNGSLEMPIDPLADEIIRDGNLKAIPLEIEPGGTIEPDMKTLLANSLCDCIRKPCQLRIVCRNTTQSELLPKRMPKTSDPGKTIDRAKHD